MRIRWQVLLGFAVIAVAGVGVAVMISLRPQVEAEETEAPVPAVRVIEVAPRDVRLVVESEGTVTPRTEAALVPEVSGRVIDASPSFVAGGFFEEGDVLLRLDATDARAVVARAEAALAQARLALEREEAEGRVRREEWRELGRGEASPLAAREPQLAQARAELAAAERELRRARADVDRTHLRAPFRGRVRSKSVDIGQFVSRGSPVAELYAVDAAEVRLPVRDDDLAWLEVPLSPDDSSPAPRVTLRAPLGGERREWTGRIVRTDGVIDPVTRLIHLVARVEDPYGLESESPGAPLLAGLFVDATIQGVLARDVVSIPRAALRDGGVVWVADEHSRLRLRPVDVLREEDERVLVRSGLSRGDRVVVSPLAVAVDGMGIQVEEGGVDAVRSAPDAASLPGDGPEARRR